MMMVRSKVDRGGQDENLSDELRVTVPITEPAPKQLRRSFHRPTCENSVFAGKSLAIILGHLSRTDARLARSTHNPFHKEFSNMSSCTMSAPSTCSSGSADSTASVASVVIITEKAVGEMNRVLTEKKLPGSTVLRIGVAGGGCSGFSYSLGFDDKCDEMNDVVTSQHGLRVAVDRKSAMFLEGTVIDFYDGIERRGFTFENPNAKKSCGCGSSFSV